MNTFLLAVELFLYAFAVYILLKKDEFAILYLPVVFFADTITDRHVVPAFAYYAIISIIILTTVMRKF